MAQADLPPLIVRNRPLLLAGVMAAMIMQTLDTTIANVALPHMAASLGATRDTITWVLTSYVLASAVVLPLAGWLVDRVGIRRMLLFFGHAVHGVFDAVRRGPKPGPDGGVPHHAGAGRCVPGAAGTDRDP